MTLLLIRAILWSASLGLLVACAGTDLRKRIIPNELVILIAAIGLALSLTSHPERVWIDLLAASALLCGLWFLVGYDLLGGGDAKLIAAVTLLVPPDRIGLLLLAIALAGGLLSGAYLTAYRMANRSPLPRRAAAAVVGSTSGFNRFLRNECSRIATGKSVPYALAVLGGVSIYLTYELYQCSFATSCSL